MKVVTGIILLLLVIFCESLNRINTVQLIKNAGYNCENHYIITEDGYILTYQRIPKNSKNVVLLMHGFLATAFEFVVTGPKRGLAFILADLGYDVWLGNARGTPDSRNHVTLNPIKDGRKFFNFSWNEIGYYDLPAGIDYILNVTKSRDLHYVGHSQGGSAFLAMASTQPEYNTKIRLALLMTPATLMEHQASRLIKLLASYVYNVETLLNYLNIFEVPLIDSIENFLVWYCVQPNSYSFCSSVWHLLGSNTELEKVLLPAVFSNFPTYASMRQLYHYGQLIRNGGFSKYDYGTTKNLKVYGTRSPPAYNLSQVTAPVAIYYSKSDRLTNYKDINLLIQRLPNVIYRHLLSDDIGHVDFATHKNVVRLVYDNLIRIMEKY